MIRARAGRSVPRPIPGLMVLAVLAVATCSSPVAPTSGPASVGTSSPGPTQGTAGSDAPTISFEATPTSAVTATSAVTPPPQVVEGCSGSDANRAFFTEAATSMSWPVYCAVLGDGWFLEDGRYRLANGGELEVAYNGPGNAQIAIVEGNVCDQVGSNLDVCAPRDSVIGPAPFGDQTGELGRLSNALVLDVDRGANPSWRVSGLGLSEADFRAICAAMLRVTQG